MVTANELVKTFNKGEVLAVDKVSFEINEGEIFGLIGPDGAGKTSIFRMLTTLLLPDSGSAMVNGFDMVRDYKSIRQTIGYMPGRFSLYQDLSVEENLDFFATVFETTVEENYDLIRDIYVQLEPFKKRRAGKLSGGMKQKLALCCTLIHKPTVLFLDEPTTGVDPVSRREFWEMLKRLQKAGITILVSTPYMDEADLCDRIALIQNGNILSIDTPANISAAYPDQLFEVKAPKMHALLKTLPKFSKTKASYAFGEYAHLATDREQFSNGEGLEDFEKQLRDYLHQQGIENITVKPVKASVEDSFIKLLK